MVLGIGNLMGLFGLLVLLPFIALYLIKPKPKEIVIPSLIFLNKSKEFRSKSGFFRRLIKDWLLLLQILILALIALFFAAPFITLNSVNDGTVILVLDTSASMGSDKFNDLKDSALANLGDKNTIILVGSKPNVLVEDVNEDDAKKAIKGLNPKDTGSAIAESLVAAKDIAENIAGDKTIVLVSDFLETEGGNIEKEIEAIKKIDMSIYSVNLNTKNKNNIGFVSLILKKTISLAVVKNFCCGKKEFYLDNGGKKELISLDEGETYDYNFDTKLGKSVLELVVDDEVVGDNKLYVSNQQDSSANVLLITDSENKYLEAALGASSEIDVKIKKPSNAKKGDYDVYILTNIESINNKLSDMLIDELRSGKSVIVFAEDGISGNYNGLLNFEIKNKLKGGASAIVKDASFTQEIDFGRQDTIREVKCNNKCEGVYVTSGDLPLIMIQPFEKGLIGYYGIPDEDEGFQNRPDYPLFWTRFVKHLGGVRSIGTMNLLTGTTLSFGEEVSFKKPSGSNMKSNIVLLDEAGFYDIEGRIYSANLLNEEESSLEESLINGDGESFNLDSANELIKKSIWEWLIIIAMVLIVMEWLINNKKLNRERYYV